MKTYIDYTKNIYCDGAWIPKDPGNSDYARFLQERKAGTATLVPYSPPPLTWTDIREKRNSLLVQSDWSVFPDSTPKPSREAWLDYRQELRDISTAFAKPEDVVWPTIPK
jgi:hypothetical protein